jgi:hypothetical protein
MSEPVYAPGTNAPQTRGTNVMAILSLVFAFVFPLLGIIFGHVARKQIRATGEGGSGLATAGLVLSYIFVIVGIVTTIFVIIVAANSGTASAM